MGVVKNGHGFLVHEALLYLENEYMNWADIDADFMKTDSDGAVFC